MAWHSRSCDLRSLRHFDGFKWSQLSTQINPRRLTPMKRIFGSLLLTMVSIAAKSSQNLDLSPGIYSSQPRGQLPTLFYSLFYYSQLELRRTFSSFALTLMSQTSYHMRRLYLGVERSFINKSYKVLWATLNYGNPNIKSVCSEDEHLLLLKDPQQSIKLYPLPDYSPKIIKMIFHGLSRITVALLKNSNPPYAFLTWKKSFEGGLGEIIGYFIFWRICFQDIHRKAFQQL